MPLYEEKFICPFSIRFSQARIRPTFQDGREVEDSMEEVEAVEAPEGVLKERYDLLLRAPFPPIEIIRWWPKLREEDGETLLDEHGKTILGEPCWFTFDNRRLYCLQAAAMKNWPCRAAAVVHVMHDLPVSKCAPKKFRTTDLGCSVRISRRDDVVPKATWTWMEAAGQIDRESAEYRRSMEVVMHDENKEHWSELLDVPSDFMGGGSGEEYQLYRSQFDEEPETNVNTRTARRILKAGGCRVSRGGTEAQAAAATVAAATAAAKARVKEKSEEPKESKELDSAASEWDPSKSEGYGWEGYYDEEMYGQDLNSMYMAAYNGAQATMAWQFQQQMMGGMLMQQMQQMQQMRLAKAKAERFRKEKEAKEQAKKRAERAREALRKSEAMGSAMGSGAMGSVGSTLLRELNGLSGSGLSLTSQATGSASVFDAKPKNDASSQSTKVGNSPSSPVSSSSLSQPGLEKAQNGPSARPIADDDDDVNCNQQ